MAPVSATACLLSSSSPGPSGSPSHSAPSRRGVFCFSQLARTLCRKMRQRAAGSRAVPTQLCRSRHERTLTPCGHLWTCSTRREKKGREALVRSFGPLTSGNDPSKALPHQLSLVPTHGTGPLLRASCSSLMTRPHPALNSVLISGCSFTGHLSSVWAREVPWRGGHGPLRKGFDSWRGGEFCSPPSGPQSPDHNVQSIVAYLVRNLQTPAHLHSR